MAYNKYLLWGKREIPGAHTERVNSMIKSMTGFGRSEVAEENRKISVELKSVNHRYLEVNLRMPKKLNFFDAAVRTYLKKYMNRGKIDIFINYEDLSDSQTALLYNETLAGEYLKYLRQMQETFSLQDDVTVTQLSRYPDVLTMEEQTADEEELWKLIQKALDEACGHFVETRVAEGNRLHDDILHKLDVIEQGISVIEERSPGIIKEYRAKLEDKVKELLCDTQIDEGRIAAEVVIYADKICTDEEVVRLRSHVEAMRTALEEKEGVGRKLDFIAQEMNREANTILSKANDIEVSNCAIGLKTEIEKVREQIQNIE